MRLAVPTMMPPAFTAGGMSLALGALLLRQEKTETSLGEFLVREGVLTSGGLDEALQLQKQLQVTMSHLLGQVEPERAHGTA